MFQWFVNVSSVPSVFFCMLQLLHLNILKVDLVLHIGCTWEAAGGTDDARGGMSDVRSSAGPLLVRLLASPSRQTLAPPYVNSVRTLAISLVFKSPLNALYTPSDFGPPVRP
jgi:hypothetical protein